MTADAAATSATRMPLAAKPGEASTGRSKRSRFGPLALIGGRILAAVPVLFGVSLLTFVALNVLPGNAAQQLLGADATPEQIARFEAELDLDRPAVERYLSWLGHVLTGDLGHSLASRQPVAGLVAERLPVTLELVAFAFALALALALPAALLSARRPHGAVDRLTRIAGMAALSVPNYVLALVLVLIFSVNLRLFPSIGFVPIDEGFWRNVKSLTLPGTAIALPLFGFYCRFLRNDLLEQLETEAYIVAAKARGVRSWRILVLHALRNSAFGLLTIVALNFGTLISGTVIIEQIFALPGLGRLLLQAVLTRDVVVVQALVLLLASFTIAANLCADLLYAVLDPRVRHGHR